MLSDSDSTATAAALDLARRGLSVFPIKPLNKTPATPNGFKNASKEPEVVEKMFSGEAAFNVGIATGEPSGTWVLDLDGPEGIEALDQLQRQHGNLPETVSATTGGGGRHLYFAYNGTTIKNRTKVSGKSIDVRGAGGYVVSPPSIHKSGKPYQWEHDPTSTTFATAPAWLIEFVTTKDSSQSSLNSLSSSSSLSSQLSFTVGGGSDLDLATAPGAGEGSRHDTATRLIGSALGKGLDPCLVAQQALDFGRRCSPPMSDEDVLRIVGDLSRKEGTKVEAIREEIEAAPLPEPAAWPVLDEIAYHGLVGKIVKTIEPQSEADPVAILIQTLISVGNLVGSNPHYAVEGTWHHCNLFGVLVGSTARGRKGTSEGRVRQILSFVDEGWTLNNIKTGLVSGEGLIWSVRDPIFKTVEVKEKGKIVGTEQVLADPGIDDKRLLVVEPEFAAVLRVCKRETNTLSPTLRSSWDSGILRTLAKNSPAKATGAHISIAGHITREELRRALTECDGFNGFANRFLWLVVKRSKLLPDGGVDLDLDEFAGPLAIAINNARTVARMRRDQGAAVLWRKIYTELADDNSTGLLAAVTSRAEAQVLRLSMVYALLDGGSTIREPHLQAALAIWRYCQESARLIFGNAVDPLLDRVLDLIRQHPEGISRREIHRGTGNHVKAAALVEVLAKIRDSGKATVEKIETGGKPAERWRPCEQSEQREQSEQSRPSDLSSQDSLSSSNSLCSQPGKPEIEEFIV